MKTCVQKWGNSLALRIPKSFAAEVGLAGDVSCENNGKQPVCYPSVLSTLSFKNAFYRFVILCQYCIRFTVSDKFLSTFHQAASKFLLVN